MKFIIALILISFLAMSLTSGHEEIQKDLCRIPPGDEQLQKVINNWCYKITSEACELTEDLKCCHDCQNTYGSTAYGKCLSSKLHCICLTPC
ncbi:hypothetical protein HN51_036187 [Arachis hypogaea]